MGDINLTEYDYGYDDGYEARRKGQTEPGDLELMSQSYVQGYRDGAEQFELDQ